MAVYIKITDEELQKAVDELRAVGHMAFEDNQETDKEISKAIGVAACRMIISLVDEPVWWFWSDAGVVTGAGMDFQESLRASVKGRE